MNTISIIQKRLFFAVTAAAVAVFFAGMAHADAATAAVAVSSTPNCSDVASGIDQIKAIQNDPTLGYNDEVKAELAVRKQLLSQTIRCANGEVDALKDALQAATVSGDSKDFEGQLISKLNDASDFYTIEQSKVDGTGITGSRAIARELIAWRQGSFDPLSGAVNNFILWTENQDLFSTAASRMGDTVHAVNFLQKASRNDSLADALSAAQSSFSAAQDKNTEAYKSLAQFAPNDQSLDLIKQSLGLLSDTYGHFSDVGDIIKKLLPQ
jgi:hypothetical protein